MVSHWQQIQTFNEAEGLHSRRNAERAATIIQITFLMYSCLTMQEDPASLCGSSYQSHELCSQKGLLQLYFWYHAEIQVWAEMGHRSGKTH